ncbi:MAG TPA: 2,3-bisphosphoglycerate-independent phosphoglycerate mutase [Candidatus Polarisedimenticolia bacterium]|jgi:2,3-bisphosphoglycerate-independent phosphoglycerate mutase|nr:2,3-bisphosphoglycerate-independent phosphoglycerate mutase [Candidatus Polarisedimenticolia bacterium]
MTRIANRSVLPLALIILDGWGYSERREYNAVANADAPHLRDLLASYPHTLLKASGESVGLPSGVIGNSEVGHICMGAGRIVYQDLSRINRAIELGELGRNEVLAKLFASIRESQGRLHLMGLLSDGGVHSHLDHLKALVRLAHRQDLEILIHAFTDGRDTPPRSGIGLLRDLESALAREEAGAVATIAGRYYAMDRDNRWDRTEKAYRAIVRRQGEEYDSAEAAIETQYGRGVTDEFLLPSVIRIRGDASLGAVRDGDGVLFFNFRADRARQLTRAFIEDGFDRFDRDPRPRLSAFAGMTRYDRTFAIPAVFPPQNVEGSFGQALSAAAMPQLRLAETEKYAHVTFFFNGGEERAYAGEERILVPSQKVATYDLKPEMSAAEIARELIRKVGEKKDLVVILNFANCDMVGHTGVYPATVAAVETVDRCVGQVVGAIQEKGGTAIITADHGNAEQMVDEATGEPHTAHTTNPVRLLAVSERLKGKKLREEGLLADVAPTLLEILELEAPTQMEGRSLFEG